MYIGEVSGSIPDLATKKIRQLQKAIFDQKQQQTQNFERKDDQMINSIKGLAGFLRCSVPTAQQFKNRFPEIFYQIGRKFLVSKMDILSKMKLA